MLAIMNIVGAGYFYISINIFEIFLGCSEITWKHFDHVGSMELQFPKQIWSSAQSRANYALLLRQDLPEYSAQRPLKCEF